MSAASVEVFIDDGLDLPLGAERVERAVAWALAAEGVEEAEVSVAILDDEQIARLNREYLDHEGPTDVISFPLHAPGQPVLGDIYIGAEQARRQAAELGVELAEEVLRLALHGTLHVLGYDHPEGEEREETPMYRRQEELLRGFLASAGGTA
jgi:probable rRNA maturation factor